MTREKIAFDTVANIPRDKIKPENHAYGIWPKLAALHNAGNPLGLLLQMARHHDGCIPLQMRSQKVFLLTEAQHFNERIGKFTRDRL